MTKTDKELAIEKTIQEQMHFVKMAFNNLEDWQISNISSALRCAFLDGVIYQLNRDIDNIQKKEGR